jgi:hypothetical protein
MMVFMVGFSQKSRVNANSFHFCKLYLPDGEASPEVAPEHILLPSRLTVRNVSKASGCDWLGRIRADQREGAFF